MLFLIFFSNIIWAAIPAPETGFFLQQQNWSVPNTYWEETLPAAKEISETKELIHKQKYKTAKMKLEKILKKNSLFVSAFQDLVLLNLAQLELEQYSNYSKVMEYANKFLIEYEESAWKSEMVKILAAAEMQEGIRNYDHNKKSEAIQYIYRGLSRLPWKEWDSYTNAVNVLVKALQELSHPLLENILAEIVHAIPEEPKKIREILMQLPAHKREKIYQLALHASGNGSRAKGVRPIQPDEELLKNGMEKILDQKWDEALDIFHTFQKIYPESTEMDRVEYLEATCLEVLNKKVESEQKYKEILQNSTLSYYALESALRTSTKLDTLLSKEQEEIPNVLEGTLLPQQARCLWRARALLQVGLEEEASDEMESLFRYRPNGIRFGQIKAKASLMLASIFAQAQYFPATFFHVRAAFQKDNSLLTKDSLELYFPNRFYSEAKKVGAELGLDPFLILSIAKQESAFRKRAVSSAKAIGLMQVLSSTAFQVDPNISKKQLFEIQKNIRIGAEYFKKLLDQFGGNIAVALAAYNAGPSRARQWMETLNKKPLFAEQFRADIFIETIPFKETREYVGAIVRNYAWYKFLNNETLPSSVEKLVKVDNEKKQNQ